MSSSQSIPDLVDNDEVIILDPPVSSPHNRVSLPHHLAPDQGPAQHHTVPSGRDPSLGNAPFPTNHHGSPPFIRPPRGTTGSPSGPRHVGGRMMANKHARGEAQQEEARRGQYFGASSESGEDAPSPHTSKKRRLDIAPNPHSPGRVHGTERPRPSIREPGTWPRPPEGSAFHDGHVKQENFNTSFGNHYPSSSPEGQFGFRRHVKQESFTAKSDRNSPPFSPEYGRDSPAARKPVFISESALLLKAKLAGSEVQNPARSQSPPAEPLPPPVASKPDLNAKPLPPPGVAEPKLCAEQAELVDLICSGRNVFYTGSAGCGKSTVLKAFTKRLKDKGKKVHILAPTGRAALQVNGATTWTYAGWTPDSHKKPLEKLQENAHGKFAWKRFKKTDVIVIDEISMVENLHFERLNRILQHALFDPKLPVQKAFGGIQIVVTGDFCQLPPVRPFQHCMQCGKELKESYFEGEPSYKCPTSHHPVWRDEDKWAFASDAWNQCNFVHFNLKTIHRQNDLTFIRILNKCRIGEALSESDKRLLMDHPCKVHNATKLFATREEVAKVNHQQFEKLTAPRFTYWTHDSFRLQEQHPHLRWKGNRKGIGPAHYEPLAGLDEHRFDQCVELKKGMLVVLLVNLNLSQGLCNGSQGIVCGFKPYEKDKLPKAARRDKRGELIPHDGPDIFGELAHIKEREIKSFIERPCVEWKQWLVVRFHNGVTRVIHADCSVNELGDERPYSLMSRTQIPLAPAWAMTIHKSQSLTLDRVIVNLSKAFEVGQVYVALSRATGLEGLKIEGDVAGLEAGLGGNAKVQRFLRHHFGALNG